MFRFDPYLELFTDVAESPDDAVNIEPAIRSDGV
jgi:hypothetical protein